MKIRTEQVIDLDEWDKLVQKTYGRPYSFQQQDGCQSRGSFRFEVPSDDYEYDFERDSIPEKVNGDEMGVSFAAWLARDPKAPITHEGEDRSESYVIELFWHRNFYPNFSMVAADLHAKGLLKTGKYTINIDW